MGIPDYYYPLFFTASHIPAEVHKRNCSSEHACSCEKRSDIEQLQLHNKLVHTHGIDQEPLNCLVLVLFPAQHTFNHGSTSTHSPQVSGFAGADSKTLENFCTKKFVTEVASQDEKQIVSHMFVVIDERTLEDGTVRVSQYDVGYFFDEETGESDDAKGMAERWESLRCRWHELGWFLQLFMEDSLITWKAAGRPPMKEDDVWIGDDEDDGETFAPRDIERGEDV